MGMEQPAWQQQGMLGSDMERLMVTMQAVEQACSGLQEPNNRAAAEATLLAFRRSSHPVQACQYILEHSHLATARFQAAATMQEAAVREWTLLSAEDKNSLRTYCLHYVMARAEAGEPFVQSKVLAVAAVLLKRGWLDSVATEKESFFNEVRVAVLGTHGPAAQRSGIALLESLVSEFSPSTASAMGLPAEFHEHCRASLELDYLQQFYSWAQDAAVSSAERAFQGVGTPLDVNVCSAALHLMSQILNWEFQGTLVRGPNGSIVVGKNRSNAFTSSMGRESIKRPGEHASVVQPGPAWHDTLLPPNRVGWVLELYARIRQGGLGGSGWIDSPFAVNARQLIVQLCSLSGSIFPVDGNTTQDLHLQRLMSGISPWLDPPEHIVRAIKSGTSESEFLDGCRALVAVASLTSPSAFDQLLRGGPRPVGTLNLLASLTCEIIKASGAQNNEEETWTGEALDILLDSWTVLLQPVDLSKRIPFPPNGIDAAAAVFHAYVETHVKAAAASAHEEGDDTEQLRAAIAARDEHLSAIALVARAAPSATVPLLAMLISERCTWLPQCTGGRVDPTSVLEELHWLLLMSGHVLADSGDGETPLVPESLSALSPGTADPVNHPAVLLSQASIDLARQSLETSIREVFSPRLMEAVVWFFGRWVDTYLMPADAGRGPNSTPSSNEGELPGQIASNTGQFDGRNSLVVAFGEEGGGKAVLETLVRVAVTALTAWPGERTLQEIVCFQFLPALVRRRNICAHLVTMEAWQELAHAFAYQQPTLSALAAPIQRALSEALCKSAAGMSSGDATNQYVKDLLGPITGSITGLSKREDFQTFAQQPDVILQVSCLMERLRGAARATLPRSQKAIFEVGAAVMEPLLILLQTYKHQSSVVYLLLKYVVDWVDGQVAFLEAKETAILFHFCVRLLEIYSAHNIGKVSVSKSMNLISESQTEKYKDLRVLLQLLTNLSSKDLIDFACDLNGEVENPDVAQVVYLGLHIITPLMSVDLLKYPKLCRQYFTLLAHMLEVYPEKVAKLSTEGFGRIVGTLDFGLRHQDVEVVNMSLTALNAVAFYHYHAVCRGQEGLGAHALSTPGPDGAPKEGVLAHFLRSVMQFLLFEDYSNELVEPAADALLPLILCNTGLYQKLAQELLEGQKNAILQSRLATAFHVLLNSNNVSSSLDRNNRRRFRENLYLFLSDVRGFLRTR
ncbi:exportin-4 [Marchantia polymorpha subsp. ruderalis]|uniref:Exportin-4 n=2 Tax=Marchantia polymorpha TaxID=3197 RepID=A0AAF6BUI1_MARPO|nr:hypothetical protein MARPO_0091s0014 [Marchantia polymorpha]BBN15665.1 hypothetical protein Mp_6g21410 [Marchantia polymorpha subsp. ruderalis]PTQ33148.1 hypothetical protein MARPO_0091s0014 [Marchantia polymorpha]PTQ33149.1 hypothetical protein MARPO_0091s0014 [Marchantia polymorpha]BBN15666.1 hypothetical protein Mp_6g21410 [Marchantia polymorpha subsp. ruderalis]|eukprot:PTQ33147.1 hypothetical protein MARPO_0091s0014 [Marchantia polymorpha]